MYYHFSKDVIAIRTQIQLTEQQARRLKELAQRSGVSMAELIRRSMERLLNESSGVSTEELVVQAR